MLVGGRRINSCLTLAVMHQGAKITTIEGTARGENLAPIQAAFIEHDAFRCGYCTPAEISETHDLGTGTYTVMAQVAADALRTPISKVRFELGDTKFPEAPVSGGSQTVASVGPAVYQAARQARDKLVAMALSDMASPLHGPNASDVDTVNGLLVAISDPARREAMIAVLAREGGQAVTREASAGQGDEKKRYAMQAFGAVFVEVHVDPDLGTVRIP